MRRRFVRLVPAVALVALCADSVESQTRPPALAADVETMYTLANGRQFTVSGRFYRGLDGQEREDSPRGATIVDTTNGTITFLNHDTKEATIFIVSGPAPTGGTSVPPTPYEQGIREGRSVSKTRVEGANGARREFWMATDIRLVVFSRTETASLTTTKELRNVQVGDPGSAVFTVPADYAVTQQTLDSTAFNASPAVSVRPIVR